MENNIIWKEIPGYEGLYEVNNEGSVRSLKFNKIKELKPGLVNGYPHLSLYKDKIKRKFFVHQLVAMAFLNHNPDGYRLVIDHINSSGFDNRLENLRIVDQRENFSKERTLKSELPTGVSKRGNKFKSQIKINSRMFHLGYFNTKDEAADAYQKELCQISQKTYL